MQWRRDGVEGEYRKRNMRIFKKKKKIKKKKK